MNSQSVLVTGANGFLGNAVAKAFSLAGWETYGLVRREESAAGLLRNEVIPIIGSAADPSFVSDLPALDVVVSTTEDIYNYVPHFEETVALFKLLSESAKKSTGKKPLVLFSSGCKDYGKTKKHGETGLAPQTEESPLNPPVLVKKRTEHSLTIFNHSDDFDAILLRPTTFYGKSGSFYAPLFTMAEQAKAGGKETLTLAASPNSVLHGTHVDDAAAAYLALALSPRGDVAGQIFNISSRRYEPLSEIVEAIEKSYEIRIEYEDPDERDRPDVVYLLLNFDQWVGSEKLRKQTGWTDKRIPFAQGFDLYRRVYEQAVKDGEEGVLRMENRVKHGMEQK